MNDLHGKDIGDCTCVRADFIDVFWGYKVLEICPLGGYLFLGMINKFQLWQLKSVGLLCCEGFWGLLSSIEEIYYLHLPQISACHVFCHCWFMSSFMRLTEQWLRISQYMDGFWTSVPRITQSELIIYWALAMCSMLWRKQIHKVKVLGEMSRGREWSDNNFFKY